MKILVFTTLYPNNRRPHHGIFVRERITFLAQLPGNEITVVAPVPYSPDLRINPRRDFAQVCRSEVIDGLQILHPRYSLIPKIGMFAHGLLMGVSLVPELRRLRRQFDFEVIDSHYVYPDGFAAVLIGKIFRKPVVVTARGSDINLFSKFRTIRPLLSFCLTRADQVISVSQALRDTVSDLKAPSEKIRVIPNGVDMAKFRRIAPTQARKALGLPLDRKMILSVGGLVELKGFDILIRALKVARDSAAGQDICLVIAGDGQERRRLERLVSALNLSDSVRFAGDVPHGDLFRWYSAADLFCLASKREGMPNVILESLACGTPVVATNVGGIPELIKSEQQGLLCERNDRDFAAAILQALSKPWNREAVVRSVSEYTWERAALSVSEVLKRAVADHRPHPGTRRLLKQGRSEN